MTKSGIGHEHTVQYVLSAHMDGKKIFEGTYPDTFEIQEEGLDQAEDAISHALGYTTNDLEPEESNYLRNRGII